MKLVMKMNKNDLRVKKTKNALYNTLMELMKTKSFEEIKVSDICNEALINRSTFYAHYNDKYELLKDAIDNLKNSLIEELNQNIKTSNTKEYYLEMISILLNHIEEKRSIYQQIMLNNRNSIMVDILYDVLDHDITSKIKKTKSEKIPGEIIAKFYIGAVFNVGIIFLKNEKKYSKQEILEYLNKLIPDDFDNYSFISSIFMLICI